jgi:small subunit ribosomal protein S21
MLIVKVNKKDGIERALKIYKNKVQKVKQNEKIRSNMFFEKKSVKKRKSKKKAIYLHKKSQIF